MTALTEVAKKQAKRGRPAPKTGSRKPAAKAKAKKPAVGTRSKKPATRADYPYEAIAKAYNEGAGPMTIADQFKIYGVGPKAKYARISNILTKLAKDGKIDRNRKSAAA